MTRYQLCIVITITVLSAFWYRSYFFSSESSLSAPSTAELVQDMASFSPPNTVIVVGAGLAGLSASYSALRAGAVVRLLERAEKAGGNSIKASSGINGSPTRFQKGLDTTFYSDTIRSAGQRLAQADESDVSFGRAEREALIKKLTAASEQAIEFLVEEVGVDLSVVAQLGGHSFPRTHRGAGKLPPGAAIVSALLDKLRQDPKFDLLEGCEVNKLITAGENTPRVTGVQYTKSGVTSKAEGAVVFTTGGFAGDTWGMLRKFRPDLAGLPSTNDPRPGTHSMLEDIGAHLIDMESVQIHPTGFVLPSDPQARVKFLAAEMLRGEGGILLHRGKRFVNEMGTREHVSNVIMELEPASTADPGDQDSQKLTQWDVQLILDPGSCEAASSHIGFYLWKGLLSKKKVKDLDHVTRDTIRSYSHTVSSKQPDEFGRDAFGSWRLTGSAEDDEQDVCIGQVTPVTHFTMGGAAINDQGQILASSGRAQNLEPVLGLWAAGEVTGGLHGDNRLGGSSLLECVVFGQTAGEKAAFYTRQKMQAQNA